MYRARHPTPHAHPFAATPARAHKKAESRPKRARSPCEDEVRFKELQKQKAEVQHRTRQQLAVLSGLEANILDFYYTHTICYEPFLRLPNSTPLASETHGNITPLPDAPALSDGLLSLFPELKSTSEDAAADPAPPAVPPKTRYYYDSALMRLYREVAIQERDLARHYAAEATNVASTEQRVQADIIDGALAAQQGTERDARAALSKLEVALAELRSQCSEYASAIEAAESRIGSTERAVEACERRKAILEARKQEQMENAEKIKDEVAAFRRCVEASERDLEQRTRINKSLEEEISRRKNLLRRKRKD